MRIIHISDLHIGKFLNEYSLLADQKNWAEKFIEKVKVILPDVIIISGDIYDRSVPSSEAIAFFNEFLSQIILELNIKVFIISGNHDSGERLSFGNEFLEKCGLFIVGKVTSEIKKVTLTQDNMNYNFYMLPYLQIYNIKMLFKENNFKDFQSAFNFYTENMRKNINKNDVNILIAHNSFSNNESDNSLGGSDYLSLELFSDFDYIACGHFHSPLKITENAYYSGSPLKYSLNEVNQEKSFYIVDFKGNRLNKSKDFIKPLHDVKIIRDSYENIFNNYENSEDYIQFELTDKKPILNAIQALKAKFPNILGICYPDISMNNISQSDNLKSVSQLKNADDLELFKEFFKKATEQDLTDDEESYIKATFKSVKEEKI